MVHVMVFSWAGMATRLALSCVHVLVLEMIGMWCVCSAGGDRHVVCVCSAGGDRHVVCVCSAGGDRHMVCVCSAGGGRHVVCVLCWR